MPFSDPEAKRRWQAEYNRRYYRANKTTRGLVRKAVSQKRDLRTRKRRWILDRHEDRCSTCGGVSMALELTCPTAPLRLSQRAIVDYSWEDLRAHSSQIVTICRGCRNG